jgi:hypothetical protein
MPRQITRTRAADAPELTVTSPEEEYGGGMEEFAGEQTTVTSRSERRRLEASEPDEAVVNPSQGKGWVALKRHKQETERTSYAQNLKIAEGKASLVKFIDEEPFDSYYRHWLRGIKGRQTFTCLRTLCPLCDIGDTPTYITLFNVIDMADRANPEVKIWEASPNPAGKIEEWAFSDKHSPVNRSDLYWSVTKKKGGNGFTDYSAVPVKARDLPDDWYMEPLTSAELEELSGKRYDSEVIRVDSRQALREVVQSLEDE